ncbi:hypothetical protein B9Z19DRAFT_1106959 [Tuber borchii]|uniref:Fungal-type protein kinase domain-containing protein n=1 Tax=Tuber borchii TaxID=42251 RepID=A0A2T6ZYP2_TUBBO|nr:hypothetical protein B9Z19DRAFT_1106959 [Tuber borchii]
MSLSIKNLTTRLSRQILSKRPPGIGHRTMADDTNNNLKKRTIEEAEKRLQIRINGIRAGIDKKTIDITKEVVYYHILQYLEIEGYPTEASSDFKEANVSDLVLYIIGPIISATKKSGRRMLLKREKEIISVDGLTGEMEEFLVIDRVAITEEKSVLIIEAKRILMGQAMAQILLAMRDASDNNSGGIIYGFVTTGEDWRMLSYDGRDFVMANKFTVLFNTMRDEKEGWLQGNAIIVDCMLIALTNGGLYGFTFCSRKCYPTTRHTETVRK